MEYIKRTENFQGLLGSFDDLIFPDVTNVVVNLGHDKELFYHGVRQLPRHYFIVIYKIVMLIINTNRYGLAQAV